MRSLRALPHPTSTGDLADAVSRHPQAFSRDELVAIATPRKVRTAIDRGDVVRLLPNAYVAAEHQDSFEARADAALTWTGEGSMLAGASALYVWTVLDAPPATIDIATRDHRLSTPPQWLKLRRPTYEVRSTRVNGHMVAPLAVALAQGYADLTPDQQSSVVFSAVGRGLVTVHELRSVLSLMPRIRQRRRLTSRIAAAEQGAESWLEELGLQRVFVGKEFERFVRQHHLRVVENRYRLDMYDPFTRTAVELDSVTWHSGDKQRLRDIRRDAELAATGILTVRLSSRDLTERPDWCRDTVRAVLAGRGPR